MLGFTQKYDECWLKFMLLVSFTKELPGLLLVLQARASVAALYSEDFIFWQRIYSLVSSMWIAFATFMSKNDLRFKFWMTYPAGFRWPTQLFLSKAKCCSICEQMDEFLKLALTYILKVELKYVEFTEGH